MGKEGPITSRVNEGKEQKQDWDETRRRRPKVKPKDDRGS